ncbi:DUF4249 domain-containing protein [Mucilaginibacter celer]|nr:DUF4249 domain-containing protein [Mucilaginibacter celer]
MKNTIKYIIPLLIAATLSACEKAIDLKLKDSTPQYVVEGVLTNEAGGCKVLLSKTKNFTDNNNFNGIGGATVTIADETNTYTLSPTSAGIYQNNTLTGTPGHTYKLNVSVDGKTFTSTCTMLPAVKLDSIYLVKDELINNKDGTPRKYVTAQYHDPAGVKNYYRFVQYVNGRKEETIMLEDDEFTDGQDVNNNLRFSNDNDNPARDIRPGNEVTIEMFSIDQAVYKYFYSLSNSANGDGNNAAPANPMTNIKGGALGYFSAHTVERKKLTAP